MMGLDLSTLTRYLQDSPPELPKNFLYLWIWSLVKRSGLKISLKFLLGKNVIYLIELVLDLCFCVGGDSTA